LHRFHRKSHVFYSCAILHDNIACQYFMSVSHIIIASQYFISMAAQYCISLLYVMLILHVNIACQYCMTNWTYCIVLPLMIKVITLFTKFDLRTSSWTLKPFFSTLTTFYHQPLPALYNSFISLVYQEVIYWSKPTHFDVGQQCHAALWSPAQVLFVNLPFCDRNQQQMKLKWTKGGCTKQIQLNRKVILNKTNNDRTLIILNR